MVSLSQRPIEVSIPLIIPGKDLDQILDWWLTRHRALFLFLEDRSEEAKCGRPLGIFAGPDNLLYIADAYYGVFTYDVTSGKKTKLFGPSDVIAGRKAKLFNSLAVASDGTLYWSDSTSDVLLQDGLYSLLADGSGRFVDTKL